MKLKTTIRANTEPTPSVQTTQTQMKVVNGPALYKFSKKVILQREWKQTNQINRKTRQNTSFTCSHVLDPNPQALFPTNRDKLCRRSRCTRSNFKIYIQPDFFDLLC